MEHAENCNLNRIRGNERAECNCVPGLRAQISLLQQQIKPRDERYYWPHGGLKWGSPIDVGHLVTQLQTLDPLMKVSAVNHITHHQDFDVSKPLINSARACVLSLSRERWGEDGWLDFSLPVPECLAIWASERNERLVGLSHVEKFPAPDRLLEMADWFDDVGEILGQENNQGVRFHLAADELREFARKLEGLN